MEYLYGFDDEGQYGNIIDTEHTIVICMRQMRGNLMYILCDETSARTSVTEVILLWS